jgi:hypothetical protein
MWSNVLWGSVKMSMHSELQQLNPKYQIYFFLNMCAKNDAVQEFC